MRLTLLPQTVLGKFSAAALLLFAFALLARILQAEIEVFHTRAGDLLAILFFFVEYLAGFTAWLSGVIAIIRNRERSVLVWAYTIIPVLLILFIIGKGFLQ